MKKIIFMFTIIVLLTMGMLTLSIHIRLLELEQKIEKMEKK
jgi:CHASE3 domain sensor protein